MEERISKARESQDRVYVIEYDIITQNSRREDLTLTLTVEEKNRTTKIETDSREVIKGGSEGCS